jgi:hypothetical protein
MRKEGFQLKAGSWEEPEIYGSRDCPLAHGLIRVLGSVSPSHWGGFQFYYPMTEKEVRSSIGADLVDAMMAVFGEVTPLMNCCMQTRLAPSAADRAF